MRSVDRKKHRQGVGHDNRSAELFEQLRQGVCERAVVGWRASGRRGVEQANFNAGFFIGLLEGAWAGSQDDRVYGALAR
ncbi:hypothetical protein D3C80_1916150 [compost metagenome]